MCMVTVQNNMKYPTYPTNLSNYLTSPSHQYSYTCIFQITVVKFYVPSMFQLDVMNKTVANFHKSVVTTHKVYSLLSGSVKPFFVLVSKPLDPFHSEFGITTLDNGPQCKVKNNT